MAGHPHTAGGQTRPAGVPPRVVSGGTNVATDPKIKRPMSGVKSC